MTKFLNISTDGTLAGNSDSTVVSEKAIKTYVDGSIPTVNNATITITQGGVTKGSFTLNQASGDTIALDAGGGGSVAIDNTTITENASQEIQAIAVIDQNTGIAKTWTGTMAEYDAIVTKDPETEYIITDDIGGSATEIGQITEALNNKVDKGFDIIEFQEPTAANNYTWYKKYRNGWVEQGGKATKTNTAKQQQTFTMPVQMANNEYQVQAHIADNTETDFVFEVQIKNQTTTGFDVRLIASYDSATWTTGYSFVWLAVGMAA